MRQLMETNVYEPHGRVVISGACLEQMEPEAFGLLTRDADGVYSLCLENGHINMAITKIAAMLGTGRVTGMRIISVDRSPHCTQMHYIKHELERTMEIGIPFESIIVSRGEIVRLSDETIELSKSLAALEKLKSVKNW